MIFEVYVVELGPISQPIDVPVARHCRRSRAQSDIGCAPYKFYFVLRVTDDTSPPQRLLVPRIDSRATENASPVVATHDPALETFHLEVAQLDAGTPALQPVTRELARGIWCCCRCPPKEGLVAHRHAYGPPKSVTIRLYVVCEARMALKLIGKVQPALSFLSWGSSGWRILSQPRIPRGNIACFYTSLITAFTRDVVLRPVIIPLTPAQYENRVAAIVNTLGRKHVRFCAEHVLRLGFSTGINDIGDGPFEKWPSHQRQTLLVYPYSYCIAKTPPSTCNCQSAPR